MPSSPEPAAWQLAELRGGSLPAPPLVPFAAATPLDTRPPVFEVSRDAGIPDDLLASARAAAQAAGYAAGWAGGIRAARIVADAEAHTARAATERITEARRAAFDQALTALDEAAAGLERRAVPGAGELEELILTSALAIAEQLVGHSLRNDADRAPAALARALALAPAGEDVTVRLSPADYDVLTADGAPPHASPGVARVIDLIADPALQPGDAVATCGATAIDARIAAGLARVREVLAR